MGQQFLEGQALLGPVLALGELFQVGVRRRPVQVADGLVERAEVEVAGQLPGQPVRQAVGAEARQGELAEAAQALLGEAFGGGVDGRQGLLHRGRFVAAQGAVLRVVDLQASGAGTDFAVAAQLGPALEAVLLRLAEVEEAQAERPAAVLQAHQQAAPTAHDHVRAGHDAFDHRILPRTQFANGGDAGAVLVARGQVEEDVLQVFQADLGELFRQRRAHALERGDRDLGQFGHAGCGSPWVCGWATEQRRMESASTSMARGRGKLARQAMATVRKGTGGVSGRISITPGA
ncbi:hypothetical protein D9M69_293410 [compost metagenome]